MRAPWRATISGGCSCARLTSARVVMAACCPRHYGYRSNRSFARRSITCGSTTRPVHTGRRDAIAPMRSRSDPTSTSAKDAIGRVNAMVVRWSLMRSRTCCNTRSCTDRLARSLRSSMKRRRSERAASHRQSCPQSPIVCPPPRFVPYCAARPRSSRPSKTSSTTCSLASTTCGQ